MIAVLTGDIVHSRKVKDKAVWLERIKAIFHYMQQNTAFEASDLKWDIYRGDSFQCSWSGPSHALYAALLLRAGLRALPELYEQKVDVRLAIGIGAEGYKGEVVSESDGEAFQLSGLTLDALTHTPQRLRVKTAWPELNASLEASLPLVETLMTSWTQPINEAVYYHLLYPELTQTALAEKMAVTQPTINWRLSKSHIDLILNFERYFSAQVTKLYDAR